MKRTILFALFLLLASCAAPTASTPATVTPPLPTLSIIVSETSTSEPPTPTLEPAPTIDPLSWQSEAGGKILFQMGELNLFDRDQFTVNPEFAEKLYKDVLLKFVYAVNRAGDVDGFAKTYPTFEMFAKMVAENPGATYDELQILANHPDSNGTTSKVYGQWLPAGEGVTLDRFIVDLAEPDETKDGNFIGLTGHGAFKMEVVERDGINVVRFVFTNNIKSDNLVVRQN